MPVQLPILMQLSRANPTSFYKIFLSGVAGWAGAPGWFGCPSDGRIRGLGAQRGDEPRGEEDRRQNTPCHNEVAHVYQSPDPPEHRRTDGSHPLLLPNYFVLPITFRIGIPFNRKIPWRETWAAFLKTILK